MIKKNKCPEKRFKVSPKSFSLYAPMSTRLEVSKKYETDFFQWTQQQASLLASGQLDKLDIENLVEEIKSLGKSDKRALKSHLIILLTHLLKKKYQPAGEGNSDSWNASINNAVLEIQLILEDSPSLKKELKAIYEKAYGYAREKAAFETNLKISVFSEKSSWKLEEVIRSL